MGKKIIIRDADFSENAIVAASVRWYYRGFSLLYGQEESQRTGGSSNGGWSLVPMFNALKGKTINVVKGLASSPGTYNFYKVNKAPNTVLSLPNRSAYITINSSDVGNVKTYALSTPIVIGNNEYLICGEQGLGGGGDFMFLRAGTSPSSYLYFAVGQATPQINSNIYEWLDYGFDSGI